MRERRDSTTTRTDDTRSGRDAGRRGGRPLCITGASGTLGRAVARICGARGWPYRLLGRRDMDIAEPASVVAALDALAPWAVVNTSGYVRVDDAEDEPERCFRENATGPAVLAAACAARGLALITFSSDLVFDGRKGAPYLEGDPTAPLNVYDRLPPPTARADGRRRPRDDRRGGAVHHPRPRRRRHRRELHVHHRARRASDPITATLRALRLADAAGLPASSHYADELSAHLLRASPNPVSLEKHAFALDPYLEVPQEVEGGRVHPTEDPGAGRRVDRADLAAFRG